jgi:hypothetical protein
LHGLHAEGTLVYPGLVLAGIQGVIRAGFCAFQAADTGKGVEAYDSVLRVFGEGGGRAYIDTGRIGALLAHHRKKIPFLRCAAGIRQYLADVDA